MKAIAKIVMGSIEEPEVRRLLTALEQGSARPEVTAEEVAQIIEFSRLLKFELIKRRRDERDG